MNDPHDDGVPGGSLGAPAAVVSDEPVVTTVHDIERPERSARTDLSDADAGSNLTWGTRELVHAISTFIIVAGCTLFVMSQLHLEDVFSAAIPTGGDMGAHVWAPAYLRDHLLNHFKLTGWSMDWYSGLPVYRFYMLPPALLVLALDLVMPYGMAMKIVSVLGLCTLPLCAYAFGRLGRFPYPVPALFAVAATVFLFDETFTILGGNIASTMAGEFSFSIALSLGLLGLGVFARGMDDGRYRGLAALLIALAALSHGIVVFFVAIGALLLWLISIDLKRTWYALSVGLTALALAAFWLVPFILSSKYMTDMKYEGAPTPGGVPWNSYWRMFFPRRTVVDQLWTLGALAGFIAALVRRHRVGAFLGVYSLVLTAMIFLSKEGIPGFGLLWNVRLLPFLYLLRYMLAMVGIVELVWFGIDAVRNHRIAKAVVDAYPADAHEVLADTLAPPVAVRHRFFAGVAVAALVSVVGVGWLAFHLGKLPTQKEIYDGKEYRFEVAGIDIASSKNNGFVDGWAKWNYTGYEAKSRYAEYRALVETMKGLGEDPIHGCGRAMWEHLPSDKDGNSLDYGTPMALMLLPFWTDSCIGSSEGLYFEASATTPYHFLASAASSEKASNPVRGLTYDNQNAALAVRYMQQLGMRYYMAWSPTMISQAAQQPELVPVATSGPWHIYEVAGSDLVVPLTTQPVVVRERSGDQRERWLEVGASYFQHPDLWAAIPVADGPADWQRVTVQPEELLAHPKVDLVKPVEAIEPKPLPAIQVTDVKVGDESLSFHVDQVGVPVVVRVSYFPNWSVEGAEGPFRVAPNMMVVVPTAQDVRLSYGPTGLDYAAYVVSLLGLVALVVLWRAKPVQYRDSVLPPAYVDEPDPFAGRPADDDLWWNDDAGDRPLPPPPANATPMALLPGSLDPLAVFAEDDDMGARADRDGRPQEPEQGS